MPEVPGVRRALAELPPGRRGLTLELRSGESLEGELVGFDGELVVLRTSEGDEEIEAEEVIGVVITERTEGPE